MSIVLLIAVTLWGASFIGTKMALEYLTPIEIVAIRLLMGTPFLYLIMKFKRIKLKFRQTDLYIIIPASIILGGHFIIQALGLIYTSATNTAWLIATIPIFIAMAAYLIYKEKLTYQKIAGIVIATVGVIFLVSKGNLSDLNWLKSIGDWIILLSCLSWTIYTIITRNISRRMNPLGLLFCLLLLPTIFLPVYVVWSTPLSKFEHLPLSILAVLLFLGIFTLALAHWLWLEGLARKGTANVGVYLYFEPIVTTLAAIPLLGEKLAVFSILGAFLIIGGVYLVERRPL